MTTTTTKQPRLSDILVEQASILDSIGDLDLTLDGELTEEELAERAELQEAALAYLDELAKQEAHKVDNIGRFIRKQQSTIDRLKDEEKRIAAKRKAMEKRAAQFKQFLLMVMDRHGITKTAGEISTLYIKKSKRVEVDCLPEELPDGLFKTTITHAADKTAIRKAMEAGQDVPRVRIEESRSVCLR